jgi:hypothetical protein
MTHLHSLHTPYQESFREVREHPGRYLFTSLQHGEEATKLQKDATLRGVVCAALVRGDFGAPSVEIHTDTQFLENGADVAKELFVVRRGLQAALGQLDDKPGLKEFKDTKGLTAVPWDFYSGENPVLGGIGILETDKGLKPGLFFLYNFRLGLRSDADSVWGERNACMRAYKKAPSEVTRMSRHIPRDNRQLSAAMDIVASSILAEVLPSEEMLQRETQTAKAPEKVMMPRFRAVPSVSAVA